MEKAKTLGGRIQAFRKAAGLSQESLGERLGVSRQAVSRWEADAAVPELEKLIAMSRLFGVTVGVLLGVESTAEAAEAPCEDAAETTDPAMAPEAESPAHELTERELAAVEAIAEKYLAAQQARSSRKRLSSSWRQVRFSFWSCWQAAPCGTSCSRSGRSCRWWRPPPDSRSSPSPGKLPLL